MRYAIEKDGIPINIILADSDEIAALCASVAGGTARRLADGETVALPESPGTPPAETTINRHQAKIVLLRHGMLATVEAIIASGSEEMQLAWQEAPQFRRTSPTLLAMARSLDLSEAQVDALFAEAVAVEV